MPHRGRAHSSLPPGHAQAQLEKAALPLRLLRGWSVGGSAFLSVWLAQMQHRAKQDRDRDRSSAAGLWGACCALALILHVAVLVFSFLLQRQVAFFGVARFMLQFAWLGVLALPLLVSGISYSTQLQLPDAATLPLALHAVLATIALLPQQYDAQRRVPHATVTTIVPTALRPASASAAGASPAASRVAVRKRSSSPSMQATAAAEIAGQDRDEELAVPGAAPDSGERQEGMEEEEGAAAANAKEASREAVGASLPWIVALVSGWLLAIEVLLVLRVQKSTTTLSAAVSSLLLLALFHVLELHLLTATLHDRHALWQRQSHLQGELQRLQQQQERVAFENNMQGMKRRFTAQLLHDIGSPLTAAAAAAMLARDAVHATRAVVERHHASTTSEPMPAQPCSCCAAAQHELSLAEEAIDTIRTGFELISLSRAKAMDLTRLFDGRQLRPSIRSVDVRQLVRQCQQVMSALLAHKNSDVDGAAPACVNLQFSVDRRISKFVLTDGEWVSDSLSNLVANAIRFTERGFVRVSVRIVGSEDHAAQEGGGASAAAVAEVDAGAAAMLAASSPSGSTLDHSPSFLMFSVEDTGIGVPARMVKRLFKPFSQAMRGAGGTGLGLWSVRVRAEALGGAIGFSPRSDGKDGSIFFFAVPYSPDELLTADDFATTPAAATSAAASTASTAVGDSELEFSDNFEAFSGAVPSALSPLPPPSQLPQPPLLPQSSQHYHQAPSSAPALAQSAAEAFSFLFIEDDAALRNTMRRVLSRDGFSVETARNGAEGLARMQQSTFSAVLCDLNMPIMDGFEAMKRFRAWEAREMRSGRRSGRQLIFALSGNALAADRRAATRAGADAFIAKPIHPADLIARTRSLRAELALVPAQLPLEL